MLRVKSLKSIRIESPGKRKFIDIKNKLEENPGIDVKIPSQKLRKTSKMTRFGMDPYGLIFTSMNMSISIYAKVSLAQ